MVPKYGLQNRLVAGCNDLFALLFQVAIYVYARKLRTVRGEVVTNFGPQKLIPKLGSFPEPKKLKTNENETVNLQA